MKKKYDLKQLKKLADGDDDFVKEMIELFVENAPINLDEIKASLDNKDYNSIGYLAHKIKPSLDLMGLSNLKKDIIKLEELSQYGEDYDKISKIIVNLDSYCKVVISDLKKDFNIN